MALTFYICNLINITQLSHVRKTLIRGLQADSKSSLRERGFRREVT